MFTQHFYMTSDLDNKTGSKFDGFFTDAEIIENNFYVDSNNTVTLKRACIYKYNEGGIDYYAVIGLNGFNNYTYYTGNTSYLGSLPYDHDDAYYYGTHSVVSGGITYNLPILNGSILAASIGYQQPNNYPIFDNEDDLIDFCTTEPIVYTWKPVPCITGKLGAFNLSMVKEEELNDGEPVSGASRDDIETLMDQTTLTLMCSTDPLNIELDKIYAGNVDRMTVTKINPAKRIYRTKFYIAGGDTPFLTVDTDAFQATQDEVYLQFLIDEENEVAMFSPIYKATVNPVTYGYNQETMTDEQMHTLYLWLLTHTSDPDDENSELDNEDVDGDAVDPWNDIAITGLVKPTISAIDTGFTKMYMVEEGELQSLSAYMWSDSFLNNVKKFFSDPKDIIVGLTIMPVPPERAENKTNIQAGGIDTGIQGYALTDQYLLLEDCAKIYIKKEIGNFLDYPPFTKVSFVLPFVGEHAADLNDIAGHTLKLSYMFDFLTGAVVAMIKRDDKPRYFFSGSTGIQVPTSAENFATMYSSILQAGATLGTTLATVATGGLAAPLAITAGASMAANGMNMAPDVSYTSGGGGNAGMLTTQAAFIRVERPIAKKASNQYKFLGKPAYNYKQLYNLSGYVKCLKLHLDNIACTDAERAEIESLLMNGVRIESGTPTPSYTPSAVTVNSAIIFLKRLSDNDVIGKTWSTAEGDSVTLESKIMFDSNLINPSFLIEGNMAAYNYCYIPHFSRFYYITEMTAKTGNLMEIKLKCDVLQSWKGNASSGILSNYAIIERQQSQGNALMNDNMMWTQVNKNVATVPFVDDSDNPFVFGRDDNVFILTVAGG